MDPERGIPTQQNNCKVTKQMLGDIDDVSMELSRRPIDRPIECMKETASEQRPLKISSQREQN